MNFEKVVVHPNGFLVLVKNTDNSMSVCPRFMLTAISHGFSESDNLTRSYLPVLTSLSPCSSLQRSQCKQNIQDEIIREDF